MIKPTHMKLFAVAMFVSLACDSRFISAEEPPCEVIKPAPLTLVSEIRHGAPQVGTYSDHPFESIAFSPDGKNILGGTSQENGTAGVIQVWDRQRRQVITTLNGYRRAVSSLEVSRDGETVASMCRNMVLVWDLSGCYIRRMMLPTRGDFTCLSLSPDGRSLAVGSGPYPHFPLVGQAGLLDIASGEWKVLCKEPTYSLQFSPNGAQVAIDTESAFKIYDVKTGRCLHTQRIDYDEQDWHRTGVAFSPDGTSLAVICGNSVRIWEVSTWQVIHEWTMPNGIVAGQLSYSSDGTYLACGGWKYVRDRSTPETILGEVAIWEIANSKLTNLWSEQESILEDLQFVPNQNQVAVAVGNTIKTLQMNR